MSVHEKSRSLGWAQQRKHRYSVCELCARVLCAYDARYAFAGCVARASTLPRPIIGHIQNSIRLPPMPLPLTSLTPGKLQGFTPEAD